MEEPNFTVIIFGGPLISLFSFFFEFHIVKKLVEFDPTTTALNFFIIFFFEFLIAKNLLEFDPATIIS